MDKFLWTMGVQPHEGEEQSSMREMAINLRYIVTICESPYKADWSRVQVAGDGVYEIDISISRLRIILGG